MSSASSKVNLGGRWRGFFNYPSSIGATEFEAVLRDIDGLITGETSEPGDTPDCFGRILHAMIQGRCEGSSVRFVKTYDDLDDYRDLVHYDGSVHSSGNEIAGRWDIPGEWSGTFLMIRTSRASEAKEQEAAEVIEAR